jgi:flagellar hook protein FlgE
MSVSGIMRTSASGMSVQSDRMGAVADNVANVGTTGYKRASVEFSTLLPEAAVVEYSPGSVQSHIRHAISEQGAFQFTQSPTDLALQGDGYFVVSDALGAPFLTRAGSFVPNGDGDLVNAAGYRLMGVNLENGDGTVVANSAAGLEAVNLHRLALVPNPSQSGGLQVNLPSNDAAITAASLPSANSSAAQYSAKTSIIAYDNLGNASTLDIYFAKVGSEAWEISVYDRAMADPAGGFPYRGPPLNASSLQFDATTGGLTSGSVSSVSIPVPNGQTLALNLSGTTQFATAFSVRAAAIDGKPPSDVERVEVARDGTVTAVYDNGTRVDSFRIPLGRVASEDNLTPVTGNVFAVSRESGTLQIGLAGASGFGEVVSSALEQSTVDLASELTSMIESQRNYTANSRVFQTGSELMDVIVNLRR